MSTEPEAGIKFGVRVEAGSCDEAYAKTLEAVLDSGHELPGGKSSHEIIDFSVVVEDPRTRVLRNPRAFFKIVDSVARFVWMVGGNERVEDIAFYQGRVRDYSDDKLIVPGSNYGKRLFAPRPGVNQVEGAIGRLREGSDDALRRAAVVIWQAEDAVRESSDIPCAFGVFFHVREGALYTSTVFRSNNATTLLPVNLFEFGMLAEIVAVEVGAELGPLLHTASSMHVFEDKIGLSRSAIDGQAVGAGVEVVPMSPMPSEPPPLEQAYELARLEATLRQQLDAIRIEEWNQLLERGAGLDPYWLALYRVLLVHALVHLKRPTMARRLVEQLPEPLRVSAEVYLGTAVANEEGTLFPLEGAAGPADGTDPIAHLEALLDEIEAESDRALTRAEHRSLTEDFGKQVIAARDKREVPFSKEDVERALRELRGREA